jgi:hypothetical protein
LCGSVIHAFGLQWYVTKLLYTVTALLVDRFLGNFAFRRNIFLFESNTNKELMPDSWRHTHGRLLDVQGIA